MVVGGQPHSRAACTRVKDPVLSGPQGRSGQVRKFSPTPGFDPRTVEAVAGRYTDYTTRLTSLLLLLLLLLLLYKISLNWRLY